MSVWRYNETCYLNINDKKVTDYAVGKSKTDGEIEVVNFTKGMPYIFDLTFYRYDIEKSNEVIKGYTISKRIMESNKLSRLEFHQMLLRSKPPQRNIEGSETSTNPQTNLPAIIPPAR